MVCTHRRAPPRPDPQASDGSAFSTASTTTKDSAGTSTAPGVKHTCAFGRHNDDTTSTAFTAAYGGAPSTGGWTHLAGVHDASADPPTLCVSGRQSGK